MSGGAPWDEEEPGPEGRSGLGADGEASSIHPHLVLAVEVGEADLGGVLERAVGLAPRPGSHARAPPAPPCPAAARPHGPRSPLTHRPTDLPACQPTRSPDPKFSARRTERAPPREEDGRRGLALFWWEASRATRVRAWAGPGLPLPALGARPSSR
jgi:hypothetical protein